MSAEMISVILVAAGVLITIGGGFFAGLAWLLRRMDERFDKVDQEFEKVDQRFNKVDEGFAKMEDQISSVRSELNEVKVAVARLEGPQQRLIFPR